jgi:hypothetical protein
LWRHLNKLHFIKNRLLWRYRRERRRNREPILNRLLGVRESPRRRRSTPDFARLERSERNVAVVDLLPPSAPLGSSPSGERRWSAACQTKAPARTSGLMGRLLLLTCCQAARSGRQAILEGEFDQTLPAVDRGDCDEIEFGPLLRRPPLVVLAAQDSRDFVAQARRLLERQRPVGRMPHTIRRAISASRSVRSSPAFRTQPAIQPEIQLFRVFVGIMFVESDFDPAGAGRLGEHAL